MATGVRWLVALKRVPGSGLGWRGVGRMGALLHEGRHDGREGLQAASPGLRGSQERVGSGGCLGHILPGKGNR